MTALFGSGSTGQPALFFFALLVLAILVYAYSLPFFLLSVLALIVFIGAYLKRSKYWGNSGIASYDGKHFSFTNKKFQGKFKELNPSLIWDNEDSPSQPFAGD